MLRPKPKKVAWETGYDGVRQDPICPNCHEYAYERDKCVFCGQLFDQDDEKMAEYCNPTLIEKDGYTIVQTFNNHIHVYNADGRMVSHASCTRKFSDDELLQHLELTLKLIKSPIPMEEDDDEESK